MKKHLFTLLLAVVVSIGTLFAQSGTCGENLTWDLTDNVLTISGSGAMKDYDYFGYSPWYSYRSSIATVIIGDEVTNIGDWAFYDCSGLTSVTIPNSVTNIGFAAFRDCRGLTSVTIPNSVTSIGDGAFNECSSLPVIDNLRYADTYLVAAVDKTLSNYSIQEGTRWIGDQAFSGCNGLTSVTIPNSVTSIGNYAFKGCSGLTSITIPNSVTSIENYAFQYCSGLTSITIPEGVTSIEGATFSCCSGLTSVTIPESVTSIGFKAFGGCRGLTSVTIPNSVTSISYDAFYGVPNIVYNGTATGSPWGARTINGYIDGYLVYSDATKTTLKACSSSAQGDIVIPNSVTSIGDYAFNSCSGMTSVTIGNSVTSIGSWAFEYCSGLTSVTIPNSVTSIGEYAFYYCSNLPVIDNLRYADTYLVAAVDKTLSNYTIQEGTRWIGDYAFYNCTGLTSISIPKNVTSIGDDAFRNCTNLHTIYALATTPPSISNTTFKNGDKNAIVYTALGCYSAYKAASVWKYMNIQHPYQIDVTSSTATSATIIFEELGVNIASVGIEGGAQEAGNVLEYIGLEPNSEYTDVPIVLTSNTGLTETVNVSFTTTALELTTKQPKVVSSTTAILLAETNMSDAEINCGFEYKRNDAPADMAGTKVYAPVANGTMAGRLKNLKDDVYYKYRAFYESAAGNMYYGDWQYIFTGDNAIEFDPILYTYAATAVSETQATLKGYALAGSDDFTEQGFEYWAESRTANAASAPRRMPAALGEHHFVQASGISMRVTLTDLDAGTVYKYRTYAKMGEQVIYGTEMSFTTTGEYKAPTYTIRFVDYDNAELLVLEDVEEGTVPTYTGEEPTREEDEQYTYTFSGWTPAIVAATADAIYTATYTAEEKQTSNIEDVLNAPNSDQVRKIIIEGNLYIIKNGKSYNALGSEVK